MSKMTLNKQIQLEVKKMGCLQEEFVSLGQESAKECFHPFSTINHDGEEG